MFLFLFYIPTALWTLFYQNYWNINWSMVMEAKEYGWFSANLLSIDFYLSSIYTCIFTFFKSYYIILIVIFIYSMKFRFNFISKEYIIFILLFILSIMIQMFVTDKTDSIYMTKDLNFIYSIILGFMVFKISENIKLFLINRKNFCIFGLILIINSLVSLANFPLIHPYNQKVLEDHKKYMETGTKKYEK